MPAESQPDYYAVLGVRPEIGCAELRRVWRRLASRWHPDHAGPGATSTFQVIAAAYEVLSDPLARAAYDRRCGIGPGSSATAPADTAPRRRAPGVALRRLCGPLTSLIACGVAQWVADDLVDIYPSAHEAATGGMITISFRVPIRCPACAGNPHASCKKCSNKRVVEELFSAWLAMPPGVTDGTVLKPSALLRGMLRPVAFRVRLRSDAKTKGK